MSKLVEKQKTKISNARRSVAFALYSSIVQKTPVDTGRARGNWNVSVNDIDHSTTDNTTPKYNTKSGLPLPKDDEPIYISNSLPYITTLEYGGYPSPVKKGSYKKGKGWSVKSVNGYSKQAPNGMVGLAMLEFKNIVDKAVREESET